LKKIIKLIQEENREEAVKASLELLEKKEISVVDLYEKVLTKALYEIDCKEGDALCIWKEHVQTAIVRTIIEVSYPYVLEEAKEHNKNNQKVIVLCPTEEYHEIGAKMAHDYFTILGYNSTFIGANTPLEVVQNAIKFIEPDYIAISVTNFYNVFAAKRLIDAIKSEHQDVKVMAGGQAFNDPNALESIQADYHLTNFESVKKIT
jgi:methanogenic corrinoid protein MtbC1